MSEDTSTELHRKHRPKLFKHVIGQDEAVQVMQSMFQRGTFPHAALFTGPSGCGKTTLARIAAKKLECGDADFVEINAADARGIDTIRDIARRVRSFPMSGKSRVWLIDEAQKLTNDAQTALLKILEELPAHSYIFLASTDPQKLLKTIKTRCAEIRVREMGQKELQTLINLVCEREGIAKLDDEVVGKLIDCAEGSGRLALVLLNKIAGIEGTEQQMELIVRGAAQKESIELARCLFNFQKQWADAAKILQTIEDEPETVRYIVLGYAKSVLLKGGAMSARAAAVIDSFQFHFFDSKHAGLALATYRVMNLKR